MAKTERNLENAAQNGLVLVTDYDKTICHGTYYVIKR